MAKQRPGITLPQSLITAEEIDEYSLEELGKLFKAILQSRVYKTENPEQGLDRELRHLLRTVIEFDKVAEASFLAMQRGGQTPKGGETPPTPSKPLKPLESPSKPLQAHREIEIEREIETETETDREIETEREEKEINKEKAKTGAKAPTSVFHKPTLLEVKAYCEERHNGIAPEQWYDYYEANGWKVGRNAMKDWKACIRSWERRRAEEQANKPKTREQEMHELYLKALEADRKEAESDKSGSSDTDKSPFGILPF